MPKYSKKKHFRRKLYNKRIVRSKRKLVSPFPYSMTTMLKYSDYVVLNSGIGTTSSYTFRANDCYDPDYTGAGHQPRGFDQWTNMYNKFVVIGSKITARFSTDGTTCQIVGVRTNTSNTVPTDILDVAEDRKTKYSIIDDTMSKTVSSSFSFKKWIKGKAMSLDTAQGSVLSSPTNQVFFQLYTANASNGLDAPQVNAFITIQYIVRFFDPVNPASS